MLEVSSLPGLSAVLIIAIRIVIWLPQRVDSLNDRTVRPIPAADVDMAQARINTSQVPGLSTRKLLLCFKSHSFVPRRENASLVEK